MNAPTQALNVPVAPIAGAGGDTIAVVTTSSASASRPELRRVRAATLYIASRCFIYRAAQSGGGCSVTLARS